jgi:hypothetical protein
MIRMLSFKHVYLEFWVAWNKMIKHQEENRSEDPKQERKIQDPSKSVVTCSEKGLGRGPRKEAAA